MKNVLTITLLLSLLAVSGAIMAQEQSMNPVMRGMNGMPHMQGVQSMQQMPAQANIGVGTVNHLNKQNGKINLTHGPIKSLGWPGMTMDFPVSDRSLLNGIQPGEKVKFRLVEHSPGQFYIVSIVPVR